jgi:hypothetical protein
MAFAAGLGRTATFAAAATVILVSLQVDAMAFAAGLLWTATFAAAAAVFLAFLQVDTLAVTSSLPPVEASFVVVTVALGAPSPGHPRERGHHGTYEGSA